VLRDLPVNDPMQRKPNIQKAKDILGWQPKVPLDDGLRKTIDYFATMVKG
jgi:UDP-glucuronate decarboxylase